MLRGFCAPTLSGDLREGIQVFIKLQPNRIVGFGLGDPVIDSSWYRIYQYYKYRMKNIEENTQDIFYAATIPAQHSLLKKTSLLAAGPKITAVSGLG